MIPDWLASLTLAQAGMIFAALAAAAVLTVVLFGRERVAGWVEAIWKRRTGQ